MMLRSTFLACVAACALAGCGDTAMLPQGADTGTMPRLPPPNKTLFPTVNIAPAQGWPDGVLPTPPAGMAVTAFAKDLQHPRWVHVLPNGDVLVAESNTPPQPAKQGIRNWIMGKVMGRAGAGVPSANRITLLRDADGDGIAETRSTFVQGLNSPFGMALVGNEFYVANTDAVLRFPYVTGQATLTGQGAQLTGLPAGPRNHHWTKSLIASRDGSKLYATVGSNSNVAENGMEEEEGRAAIWEIDRATGQKRLFATGLRNPNGMGWEPVSGQLWTVVNERDEIGSDLVPDYLTSVKDGGFYGWPWAYYRDHVDERVKPPRPDMVSRSLMPSYALGSHVAPLGMAFSDNRLMPSNLQSGAFIGEHGSWNREPHSGYKVVFVPFLGGMPSGQPIDVLTGFLSPEGKANGRPVGVAMDGKGALLVADDVGNVIWRVAPMRVAGVPNAPGAVR